MRAWLRNSPRNTTIVSLVSDKSHWERDPDMEIAVNPLSWGLNPKVCTALWMLHPFRSLRMCDYFWYPFENLVLFIDFFVFLYLHWFSHNYVLQSPFWWISSHGVCSIGVVSCLDSHFWISVFDFFLVLEVHGKEITENHRLHTDPVINGFISISLRQCLVPWKIWEGK